MNSIASRPVVSKAQNVLLSDAFGVLSEKNTASKYWGVSKKKNKVDWMVRFVERTNKSTVNFKTDIKLTEKAAAQIAATFYKDPALYVTSTSVDIDTELGFVTVNTCTNTITMTEITPLVEVTVEAKSPVSKPAKVVDQFRALVDQIKRDALAKAKAFLASKYNVA